MPCVHKGEPKFLETLTFIKMYALNTCTTPWEVWLKTGGRAVGNLSMSLLFIDTADLARSFFRPKKARSRRHSMPWFGRGKNRIKPGLFPEPSDLIADTTRSATGLQKPKYSDGFNHLWELDNKYQRVMNKVVFTNMATDFGYDWFSGILLDPRSKCDIGRFSCGYETGPYDSGNFELPHRAGAPQYEKEAVCALGQIVLGPGKWAIHTASRVTPLSGDTGDTFDFIMMVGDTEHMKPCGKLLTLTNLGPGKFDVKEDINVVKGPEFVRVISRWNNFDGFVAGGCITLVRGFRID